MTLSKREQEEFDALDPIEQLLWEPKKISYTFTMETIKELYSTDLENLVYKENPFLKLINNG